MQNIRKVKEVSAETLLFHQNSMQNESDDDIASAETQLERATETLRDLVLRGSFPLDVKLPEARVAEMLGISRTPARLAMAALERDGLLVRLPRRGFRVRSFSLDEVVEAIEIRGELEAVAARLTAENGLGAPYRARMEACIDCAAALLATPTLEAAHRRDWCEINSEFHAAAGRSDRRAAVTRRLRAGESRSAGFAARHHVQCGRAGAWAAAVADRP